MSSQHGPRNHLVNYFSYGSSPIDWCEENYTVSPYIAEFFNTISNVLLATVPLVLLKLHKPYAEAVGSKIQVVTVMVVVVGLSSAYFHATLSLCGQLLDEISILWMVMSCFALYLPKYLMPKLLQDEEGRPTFLIAVCIYKRRKKWDWLF